MGARVDETDAAAYVEASAGDLLAELRDLTALGEYEHAEEARQDVGSERIAALGLDPEAFDRYDAEEAIDALPLAVEATTTFEVVLGVGGPDCRLCFECDGSPADWQPDPHTPPPTVYEIRRVLYRYSWSGSAELELVGEDREVAEAFARRVVPELA
jgi:hypothetical protein